MLLSKSFNDEEERMLATQTMRSKSRLTRVVKPETTSYYG
jgi:hypothetical protein